MALPRLNTPKYKVKLPSTGKEISMRPFLVKEEKILMIALESQDVEQISEAVKNIIMSCYGLDDLSELTGFDIEYLFLQLRAKSVGEIISLQTKCQDEKCGGVTPLEINIDDIEIINKEQERTLLLDDDSGVGVTLNYPSLESIAKLDLSEESKVIDVIMSLIVECIDTIFDNDNVYNAQSEGKDEILAFLESLSSEQFGKVQRFFQEAPAVYYKQDVSCVKCNNENTIELRGLNNFFT
jgi:hypothetical protein